MMLRIIAYIWFILLGLAWLTLIVVGFYWDSIDTSQLPEPGSLDNEVR